MKSGKYFFVTFLALPLLVQNLSAQNPVPPANNPANNQAPNSQPGAATPSVPANGAPDAEPGAVQPPRPGMQPSVQPVIAPPEDTETPAEPQYGGPAILSRGGTASIRTPSESIKIRPYATVTGSYDSGITPVILNSIGNIVQAGSWGVDVEAGINGYHRWRTATLGIDYKGVYRNYTSNTYYNGTDQTLALIFQKQLTRHWNLTLRETAGLLSRSLFYYGPYSFVDPSFAQAPTQDVFDGRTMYLATMGDLTYQYSARLSFNFAGDGFLTRRRSSALYGNTGYRARADIAYRTSRNATSGVSYDFTHFEYTKGFGGSDIHTMSLVQSFRIGRHWELDMQAGMSHVETLGITQVQIDPVIAAIIGRSTGVEVIHIITWAPALKGHLTRTLRKGSIVLVYDRGITPGNGLFLTSRSETGSAAFSYTGVRRLNIGASFGHTKFGSVSIEEVSNYGSWNGGAGFTYKLAGYVSLVARYDYRRYDVEQTIFKRDAFRASLGFAFSPREVPLTLW